MENEFKAWFQLRNVGFAAPMNSRDVELIFVNTATGEKYVFPQEEDPRFWMPDETTTFTLSCRLTNVIPGEYKLYLNLPDPYESLHNDPRYSIRLANEDVWEEETGYNYITTINVNGLPD